MNTTKREIDCKDVTLSKNFLSNVQVLRGMAATAVVCFHIWNELGAHSIPNSWPDMTSGAFGVDLFFVISGFIMVYTSVSLFETQGGASFFLLRRIVRIVPLYWIIQSLYILYIYVNNQDPGYTLSYLTSSYFFFPYPEPGDGDYLPAYSLGWTLQYEMFFYLLFSSVLECQRHIGVYVLSIGLIAFVTIGHLLSIPWPMNRLASTQTLEFVFGMIIAEAQLRSVRFPPWCCGFGAVLSVAAVLAAQPSIDDWWAYRGLVWGLPASLIVASAIFCPALPVGVIRRRLEALGNMSYSLYLTHYFVLIVVARAMQPLLEHPDRVDPFAYSALLLSAALIVGSSTYQLLERPLTRRLQQWVSPHESNSPSPASS